MAIDSHSQRTMTFDSTPGGAPIALADMYQPHAHRVVTTVS